MAEKNGLELAGGTVHGEIRNGFCADRTPRPSILKLTMNASRYLRLTRTALKNWFIAQCWDALVVGVFWWIGLHMLKVPGAPVWAVLAAGLQFVPHLGPVLGTVGPVLAAAIRWKDWEHPLYVLMLYAGIVVMDGFLLQPYLMKRNAKVPMWASIMAPIALSFLVLFWGILLAPPLLAVVYAFRRNAQS
jgi:predicted PurR-regulated permease PerM